MWRVGEAYCEVLMPGDGYAWPMCVNLDDDCRHSGCTNLYVSVYVLCMNDTYG